MEDIIKKAIEGGWRKDNSHEFEYVIRGNGAIQVCFDSEIPYGIGDILIDPLFWQALFKNTSCFHSGKPYRHQAKCEIGQYEWENKAICFHEINLTESWEKAVQYLQGLITN